MISQTLIAELRILIEGSRERVVRSVNSEMVLLYWHIGSRIRTEVLRDERAEYGQRVIEGVAKELSAQYGQGFGKRKISSMVRFAQTFPAFEIVQTLSAQLSWSHVIELLPIKDDLERDFYTELARLEGWSVRTLRERMNTLLYQRTAPYQKTRGNHPRRSREAARFAAPHPRFSLPRSVCAGLPRAERHVQRARP